MQKLSKIPSAEDEFFCNPVDFCGETALLIAPGHIGAKWNKQNLCCRSLIVDPKTLEWRSVGFFKFFNYTEKPDLYPNPESFADWNVEEKRDGTLVICNWRNNQFSMRTRGTASYKTQENHLDFELLPLRHPYIREFCRENEHISVLVELETPNNVIVIRPADVAFTLIGAVNMETGLYLQPNELDEIARIASIPRPARYSFTTLDEMAEAIKVWRGKEGVVLSYNKYNSKIKLKSDWYKILHRIKSELSSENNLIEFYVENKMPGYQEFYDLIETSFDFEIAEQLRPQISRLSDAAKSVKKILSHMQEFADSLRGMKTRKDQALAILASYGGKSEDNCVNRASYVFSLLDGKEITKDQIVKLFWQTLKK
jgi:hypothetical protein